MEPTKADIYAYQILHYLVMKYEYQIVTIKQQREDVWLMNPHNEMYPVIRLSAASNRDTLENMEYLRQAHRAILDIIHRESRLFIINTSEDSTPIDNEFLSQVVIHPGITVNPTLDSAFPGMKDIPADVEDRQKEYVRITKSLEELQMQMLKKQRKNMAYLKRIPKVTASIAVICIFMWVLVNMYGVYLEDNTIAKILSGAYYKMNVISMHEYWRFITAGFLHQDIFHLLMNLIALVNLGIACEKIFKRSHYIIIFITSIIVGNIFVFLLEGNMIGLGLSGGLFGLLGAFIATLYENGSMKHPMVKATVMRLLLINLMISLMPGISFYAHLGGFICGGFLGVILVPSEHWANLRKHMTICFTILLGGICGLSVRVNVVEPLDTNLDRNLLQTVRNLGIDWYADQMQEAYLKFYAKEELGL